MKTNSRLMIYLLLAGIFVAGFVTGRLTGEKPVPMVITATGRVHTTETMLAEISRRVGLTKDQEKKLRPIVEKMAWEMSKHPPRTPHRLEIFLKRANEIRPHIEPQQMEAFERFVTEQSNWQRQISKGRRRQPMRRECYASAHGVGKPGKG